MNETNSKSLSGTYKTSAIVNRHIPRGEAATPLSRKGNTNFPKRVTNPEKAQRKANGTADAWLGKTRKAGGDEAKSKTGTASHPKKHRKEPVKHSRRESQNELSGKENHQKPPKKKVRSQ
jgi:hypothetical protein